MAITNTITPTITSPTGTQSGRYINFTVEFPVAVSGFDNDNVSLRGMGVTSGTPSRSFAAITVTGSGTTWNVRLEVATNEDDRVRVILSGTVTRVSDSVSLTIPFGQSETQSNNIRVRTPSTFLTSRWSSSPSGTQRSGAISIGVNFNKIISGFAVANLQLGGDSTGASITSVTGSGANWTVNIILPANANGTLTIGFTGTVTVGSTTSAIEGTARSVVYDTRPTAPTLFTPRRLPPSLPPQRVFETHSLTLDLSQYIVSYNAGAITYSLGTISPATPALGATITSAGILSIPDAPDVDVSSLRYTVPIIATNSAGTLTTNLTVNVRNSNATLTASTGIFTSSVFSVRISFDTPLSDDVRRNPSIGPSNFTLEGDTDGLSVTSVEDARVPGRENQDWSVRITVAGEKTGTVRVRPTGTVSINRLGFVTEPIVSVPRFVSVQYNAGRVRFQDVPTEVQTENFIFNLNFDSGQTLYSNDFRVLDASTNQVLSGASVFVRAIGGILNFSDDFELVIVLPDSFIGNIIVELIQDSIATGFPTQAVRTPQIPIDTFLHWTDIPTGTQFGSFTATLNFRETIDDDEFDTDRIQVIDQSNENVLTGWTLSSVVEEAGDEYEISVTPSDHFLGSVRLRILADSFPLESDSSALRPLRNVDSAMISVDNRDRANVVTTFSDIPTAIDIYQQQSISIGFTLGGSAINVDGLSTADFRAVDGNGVVYPNVVTAVTGGTSASAYMLTIVPPANFVGDLFIELLPNTVYLTGQDATLTLPASSVRSDALNIDTRIAGFVLSPPGAVVNGAFNLAITSNHSVEGLTADDFTASASGAVIGALTPQGSNNRSWSLRVTPPPNALGSFTVDIGANRITSPPRNNVATSGNISYNTRNETGRPVVTWTVPTVTQGGAYSVQLLFSELVTGLTDADILLAGGGTFTVSVNTGAVTSAQIHVVPPDGQTGINILTLRADAVQDQAVSPNGNLQSTSPSIAFDLTDPHITTTVYPTEQPVTEAFNIETIWNEAVTLDTSIITAVATDRNGNTFNLTINRVSATGLRDTHIIEFDGLQERSSGSIIITIPSGAAIDSIRNRNAQIVLSEITYNTDDPLPVQRLVLTGPDIIPVVSGQTVDIGLTQYTPFNDSIFSIIGDIPEGVAFSQASAAISVTGLQVSEPTNTEFVLQATRAGETVRRTVYIQTTPAEPLTLVRVDSPDGVVTGTSADLEVYFSRAPETDDDGIVASDFLIDGIPSASIMSISADSDDDTHFTINTTWDAGERGILTLRLAE